MIPGTLELVVLVLGAYRLWRLLAIDEILDPIRDPLVGLNVLELDGSWTFERPRLAKFLACPYCFGFWVSLAAYGAWLSAPRPTLYAMTPFAISAAVGLLAKNLDD